MRKLSASETRLISIFGFMIFLLANFIMVQWYSAERLKLSAKIAQLEQTTAEYHALLIERPYWQSRKQWLSEHPLETYVGSASDSHFAEAAQAALTKNGITIEAQQLKDPTRDGELMEAQLEFTLKGRLEQVVRWLGQIQQPGNYIVIRAFTLRRLDEGDAMIVRIRIGKIYRTAASTKVPGA